MNQLLNSRAVGSFYKYVLLFLLIEYVCPDGGMQCIMHGLMKLIHGPKSKLTLNGASGTHDPVKLKQGGENQHDFQFIMLVQWC